MAEHQSCSIYFEAKDRMTEFSEILEWYRLRCRTMPSPHLDLTQSEAVAFQQLQAGSLPTRS